MQVQLEGNEAKDDVVAMLNQLVEEKEPHFDLREYKNVIQMVKNKRNEKEEEEVENGFLVTHKGD